jgi:hypothetical protein
VISVKEDVANPYVSAVSSGIRADLTVTIPQDASTISLGGTLSGSPSFEANVSTEGGPTANIPLQTATTNDLLFGINLQRTTTVNTQRPIPQPPKKKKEDDDK